LIEEEKRSSSNCQTAASTREKLTKPENRGKDIIESPEKLQKNNSNRKIFHKVTPNNKITP
jgi:hypothetical protein